MDSQRAETARLLTRASAKVRTLAETQPESKNYRLRLYFDSRCPHCEHMMGTLAELSRQGFYVELRRVDRVPGFVPKFPFPYQQASSEELKRQQIKAVPVLMVGNLRDQTFFKMQGFQTPEAVLTAIREARPARPHAGETGGQQS